jgi:hypothetical protein
MKKNSYYYIVTICCSLNFLVACGPQNNKKFSMEQKGDVLIPEVSDSLINVESINLKEHPDTSLSGLVLLQWSSIENILKREIKLIEDEKNDYSYGVVTNVNGSEYVQMLHYPGSGKNEFAKFILTKKNAILKSDPIQLGIVNFRTNNSTMI